MTVLRAEVQRSGKRFPCENLTGDCPRSMRYLSTGVSWHLSRSPRLSVKHLRNGAEGVRRLLGARVLPVYQCKRFPMILRTLLEIALRHTVDANCVPHKQCYVIGLGGEVAYTTLGRPAKCIPFPRIKTRISRSIGAGISLPFCPWTRQVTRDPASKHRDPYLVTKIVGRRHLKRRHLERGISG